MDTVFTVNIMNCINLIKVTGTAYSVQCNYNQFTNK